MCDFLSETEETRPSGTYKDDFWGLPDMFFMYPREESRHQADRKLKRNLYSMNHHDMFEL